MNSSNLVLPICIGLIMWGIGLQVTLSSFRRVFTHPKAIITGLSLQMVLLPAVGFALAFLLPLDPAYSVGLVIIAACPGGTSSNLLAHLLKGREALSISLTSFNSFLILFTIPLLVNLSSQTFLDTQQSISLSATDTLRQLGFTVLLPVTIGVALRHLRPNWADALRTPMRYIMPALLLFAFVWVAFQNGRQDISWQQAAGQLIPPTLLLNVLTVLIGYSIARLVGINREGRFTIGIEMGLQNSALAIFIAHSVLQNDAMARVALAYSTFSFVVTAALAWLLRRYG